MFVIDVLQRQGEQKPRKQRASYQSKKKITAVEQNGQPQWNASGHGNCEYSDNIQYNRAHSGQKAAEEQLLSAVQRGISLIAEVPGENNDQKEQGKIFGDQRPADRKHPNSFLPSLNKVVLSIIIYIFVFKDNKNVYYQTYKKICKELGKMLAFPEKLC